MTPVFLANRPWEFVAADGTKQDVQEAFTAAWGTFPWYVANRDGTPRKPTKDATQYVLRKHGWKPHEVIYVGNTEDDMRTAVNGGLLFLNAKWHGEATEYGFTFQTPAAIARFIDVFCTRDSLWFFKIEDAGLRMYAMGLYSTYDEQARRYTDDARSAAKFGGGTVSFWKQYLVSTLYLSGLCEEFSYIAQYPGHTNQAKLAVTHADMIKLAKCFRASYLPDLIVRHTMALKSQAARNQNKTLDPRNQLETICLTRRPLKGDRDERYKNSPLSGSKTVLVLDDICTEGYSLDAARSFISQTGAQTILVAWLKTPNRSFYRTEAGRKFDPFVPQKFATLPRPKIYPYDKYVVDRGAPKTIADCLTTYRGWKWPTD